MPRTSKLTIGTAQFGLPYGIANRTGQIDGVTGAAILSLAAQHSIKTLDTAIAYGNSEATLGTIGVSGWQVISKLPEMPDAVDHVEPWVEEQIAGSLKRLRIDSLDALLMHRPRQLLGPRGARIAAALNHAKQSGLIQKMGISIYDPNELDELLPHTQIDIVQAPFNLLDRRLVDSGWAQRLKTMGIELHTRSTFLQGLLLLTPENRPLKFQRWQNIWHVWDDWLKKNAYTPLEACLRYALSLAEADKVVIGIDSAMHLQEIIAAANGSLDSHPQWPATIDANLMNPSSWNNL